MPCPAAAADPGTTRRPPRSIAVAFILPGTVRGAALDSFAGRAARRAYGRWLWVARIASRRGAQHGHGWDELPLRRDVRGRGRGGCDRTRYAPSHRHIISLAVAAGLCARHCWGIDRFASHGMAWPGRNSWVRRRAVVVGGLIWILRFVCGPSLWTFFFVVPGDPENRTYVKMGPCPRSICLPVDLPPMCSS
jgi:hypothetical protein